MTDDAKTKASSGRVVPVAPSHVSQLSCLQLYGIDARRYRKVVNANRSKLRVTRVGRLVLVPVEQFDRLLATLADEPANDTDETTDTGDRSPVDGFETADEILAAVGHRRRVVR